AGAACLGRRRVGLGRWPRGLGRWLAGLGRWPRDLGRWLAGLGRRPVGLGRWPRGPGRWLAGPTARAVMTRTGLPSTRDRRRHECDHRAARLRAGPDPVGLPAVRAAVPASGASRPALPG